MQTYCTQTDIEAIWPPDEVLASVDDDASGTLSAAEEALIDRAIERAAGKMNAYLQPRYTLAALAANEWCRDTNALLAAYFLATRRGTAASAPMQDQFNACLADLTAIAAGCLAVPGAAESFEATPTVTNFTTDLSQPRAKVRRVPETSTGSDPPPGRKSWG